MYSIEQVNLRVNGIALISYFHRLLAFSFVNVEKKLPGKKKESKKSKKFIDFKGNCDFCLWLPKIDLTDHSIFSCKEHLMFYLNFTLFALNHSYKCLCYCYCLFKSVKFKL